MVLLAVFGCVGFVVGCIVVARNETHPALGLPRCERQRSSISGRDITCITCEQGRHLRSPDYLGLVVQFPFDDECVA